MIECVIGSGETEDQSDRLFLLFLKKNLKYELYYRPPMLS